MEMKNRTSWPMAMGMEAVSAVKTPHQRTPADNTRRAPHVSANQPADVWKAA